MARRIPLAGSGEMHASRRNASTAAARVSLGETLVAAGLAPRLAAKLESMPRKAFQIDPRRPFREPGAPRDEVMFVTSGLIAKFKADSSGGRQIVALRFPGEGILPREGSAGYGVQAIVKSEILVGKAEDFTAIVESNPEIQRFFWRLIQRNEAI